MKRNSLNETFSTASFHHKMTHRFASPLSELYRSYVLAEKYRDLRDQLSRKRENLSELKSEQEEILEEFERNRSILYNEQYNVQHLYEQNQNKLKRTFAKLQMETSKLERLTIMHRNVVKGMCALVNVAKVMDDFLSKSALYKNFVDDAAKSTKQFDSFSDIINKYNSLMSIFRKNADTFNSLIDSLQTTRIEIVRRCDAMEDQLSRLLHKLSKSTEELGKRAVKTAEIERRLTDLQRAGYEGGVASVRINLYRSNLLEALIASRAVDESILKQPFSSQIDIISDKFKMLTSIAKALN